MWEYVGCLESVESFNFSEMALQECHLCHLEISKKTDCRQVTDRNGIADISSMYVGETSVEMSKTPEFFGKTLKIIEELPTMCFNVSQCFLMDHTSAMPWEHRSQSHLSLISSEVSASK